MQLVRVFLPFEFSENMLRDENTHHQGFSISLSKHWKEIWSSDRASNLVVSGEKKISHRREEEKKLWEAERVLKCGRAGAAS